MTATIKDISISLITTYKTIEYCNGKYGDFEVIIRKDNGYINVTKLLAKYGKEIAGWHRLIASKIHLEKVCSHLGCARDDLSIELLGGNKTVAAISGTYYHPLLIPQIITWAKPEFGIESSMIVNQFMGQKVLDELRHEKDAVIEKHEATIDDLKKMMAKFHEKQDKTLKNAK
ncbi:KilA-N DNA-binding domain-containing protein [uncultured virus]|nr:KilA-N DNA-binding domain-containing protein [uncultured virus]